MPLVMYANDSVCGEYRFAGSAHKVCKKYRRLEAVKALHGEPNCQDRPYFQTLWSLRKRSIQRLVRATVNPTALDKSSNKKRTSSSNRPPSKNQHHRKKTTSSKSQSQNVAPLSQSENSTSEQGDACEDVQVAREVLW